MFNFSIAYHFFYLSCGALYEQFVTTNSTISFFSSNFKALLELTFVALLCSSIGRGVVQYNQKLYLPQNYSPWFIKLYGKAVAIHGNIEQ